jgi:anti-sigma factor RsiW
LNCKAVIREISNYLDGELDASAKREIEEHLDCCEECHLIINQTKLTVEIFCGSEPVELPKEVRTRLHEALRRKMQEKNI